MRSKVLRSPEMHSTLRQCGHFLEYFWVKVLTLAGPMPEPGIPGAAQDTGNRHNRRCRTCGASERCTWAAFKAQVHSPRARRAVGRGVEAVHGDADAALSDLERVTVREAAEPVFLVDLCRANHKAPQADTDRHVATLGVGPSPHDSAPERATGRCRRNSKALATRYPHDTASPTEALESGVPGAVTS